MKVSDERLAELQKKYAALNPALDRDSYGTRADTCIALAELRERRAAEAKDAKLLAAIVSAYKSARKEFCDEESWAAFSDQLQQAARDAGVSLD
jgi:hypothetical protein